MKTIVLYSSRSGNTQKIAEAIASELNCTSIKITEGTSQGDVDLSCYDLIFIGTGIRYSNPNEELMAFLKTINLTAPRHCAVFITWGGAGKTNQDVNAKLGAFLKSMGQKIIEDQFFCYGGWNLLRRGHPNAEEIKSAKTWAKKIAQNYASS